MFKVLVPVDFSENSIKACHFSAINFGDMPNIEITLLNLIRTPTAGAVTLETMAVVNDQKNRSEMQDLLKLMSGYYPNIEWDTAIEFGFMDDVMHNLTKGDQVDLVVVGTTGNSGIVGNLMGSNATQIVKSSNCSVIVVPNEHKPKKVEKLIFASDFKNENSIEPIRKLAWMTAMLKATIDLVHVSRGSNKELDAEGDMPELSLLSDRNIGFRMHFAIEQKERIEDVIICEAHELKSDLIAVIPHHEGFLKGLFHHSVTRGLTLHSDIPVFIIR